jgi:alkylation response protein AidB-like acyl-CoA dehydrogenase
MLLRSVRCRNLLFRSTARNTHHHGKKQLSLYDPTEEHAQLRQMIRSFVVGEVDQQAMEFNKKEQMNVPLFRKLGSLGILGITAGTEYGGSGKIRDFRVINANW